MANPGYVRSTDGNDADNGSTWALANATLAGAMSDQVAGDRIWISNNHAETQASAMTVTAPGTLASPNQILFGNDAAEPPTALTTSGTISTTGSNSITLRGSFYWYGGAIQAGSLSNGASISLNNTEQNHQIYESVTFTLNNTATSSRIVLGTTGSTETTLELINCTFTFGSTSQTFTPRTAHTLIRGGALAGSAITGLFNGNVDGVFSVDVDGVNLSNAAASLILVGANAQSLGKSVVFRNCKLPASWSGTLFGGAPLNTSTRVEMWNCSASDTNYAMWVEDYSGSIKHETTLVRTGGASDGDTPISWKMATTENAEYPVIVLRSPEIYIPNTTTGASKTLTVEILHDSATALKDDEIWLEVQYLGTSGFPLSLFASDSKADVIATAANQTSSSETWTTTGMSNPNKQKLAVTFTPQENGVYIAKVHMAKASYTVYVDPLVTVS